jgi:hypothetical protein
MRAEREPRARIFGRADILRALDGAVETWNVSPELLIRDARLRGRHAEHLVDRAFARSDGVKGIGAIAEAISFQAIELGEVYGTRGALIVATEDLHDAEGSGGLESFAVYSDAPIERAALVAESAELFTARDIVPVDYRNLAPIRTRIASLLHQP